MFVARETTVVRASDGDIISGHPDKISEMRDAWVFARDVKSRDPRWLLAETKGNIEDDNLMIPNTDG
jgi:predicted lipid-binding transport protein (Tim44 family)